MLSLVLVSSFLRRWASHHEGSRFNPDHLQIRCGGYNVGSCDPIFKFGKPQVSKEHGMPFIGNGKQTFGAPILPEGIRWLLAFESLFIDLLG